MYPSPLRPGFGTFVKEQVESLRAAGVDVDVLVFDGTEGARSYFAAGGTLRRRLREQPYDVVHAHYGLAGVVGRMQSRCPLVVTFHGSDLFGGVDASYRYSRKGAILTWISRLVGLTATKCIIVADVQRPKLKLSSAITIPVGVDLQSFRPMPRQQAREQLGLDQDRRLVLFVAHPKNYTKRFDVAQEAVWLLQKDTPGIELLPVYDQSHDRIPLYMNAGDVLVLTSMHEGSPCVVKEALACNLPIVSVKVGDVPERIHGVPGCYLCDRTPADVAAKVRLALAGGRLTCGREMVRDLSLPKVAQELIAVYQEIAGPGRLRG